MENDTLLDYLPFFQSHSNRAALIYKKDRTTHVVRYKDLLRLAFQIAGDFESRALLSLH